MVCLWVILYVFFPSSVSVLTSLDFPHGFKCPETVHFNNVAPGEMYPLHISQLDVKDLLPFYYFPSLTRWLFSETPTLSRFNLSSDNLVDYPSYRWHPSTNTLGIAKPEEYVTLLLSLKTNYIPIVRQCTFAIIIEKQKKRTIEK